MIIMDPRAVSQIPSFKADKAGIAARSRYELRLQSPLMGREIRLRYIPLYLGINKSL